jgi:hypothetical protein
LSSFQISKHTHTHTHTHTQKEKRKEKKNLVEPFPKELLSRKTFLN